MDPQSLRAAFPVLAERAYLNSGSFGPLPAAATAASARVAAIAMTQGRGMPYFETYFELRDSLRKAYAGVLGATPADIAITTSTSEGMVRVLAGLNLAPGDEVLTSTTEHPGLLGPLGAVRRRGVTVRTVPLAEIAESVTPATKLIACSHVDWSSGAVVPDVSALDIPVMLDGAQGFGAVKIDLTALGCAFYCGAGQKWMCGPMGTGVLYVAPEWRERLTAFAPTYANLETPADALQSPAKADASAHDSFAIAPESLAGSLAGHAVLAEFGLDAAYERAGTLAAALAQRLAEAGYAVAARGATTLVSWEMGDDAADHLPTFLERGVNIRALPGTPYLRASVGAWNDESDLDRLLDALAAVREGARST